MKVLAGIFIFLIIVVYALPLSSLGGQRIVATGVATEPEPVKRPPPIATFRMRRTIYVKDKRCIPNVKNPITASGARLQEGVAAINVVWDSTKKKWLYNSPLRMGDRIYVEGLGEFVVKDTGRFNPKNTEESYWTVDLFMDVPYEKARRMGVEMVDVHVLERR